MLLSIAKGARMRRGREEVLRNQKALRKSKSETGTLGMKMEKFEETIAMEKWSRE